MSTDELAAQVAAIKPGDTVTARLRRPGSKTDYTVSGTVEVSYNNWLSVGHDFIAAIDGTKRIHDGLVAIESHEPAKPPVPPEPTGDVLARDGLGVIWWPRADGGWGLYGTVKRHGWSHVVLQSPVTVYRPAPSPERIEELVQRFIRKPVLHDAGWLRSFAGHLLWAATEDELPL